MAKADRLLNLVAALEASIVPLTAEELRERVPGYSGQTDETFRRTFERDKDDLRTLGIPLETVPVEHLDPPTTGYRIRSDRYELEDPGFTPEELAALHLAATSVRLVGIPADELDDALRKLGGLTGGLDRPAELAAVVAPAALGSVFEAVLDRRPITFRYGGEERHLEPHRLQYERGRWYVSGHDTDRDAVRSFRLDRVGGTPTVGEPGGFEAPVDLPGVCLRPWELGDAVPVTVHVLLDETAAGPVLREDPSLEVVERRGDGSVVVELQVSDPAGLRGFVLSHLERAELLDPPELRADLVAWLVALAGTAAEATGGDRS
ncbi:MAG: WYL domain-containing protein [Actinobacteria bacterium]|nr:WYL domain-containing protein [Actinomycetota bacterium]